MTIAPYEPLRFDNTVEHYVSARVRYAPDLIAWLAQATDVAGKPVLDLGCGPGFIANAIAPHAQSVLGLDPSPSMIAAARAVADPNVRFEVGSSEDLSHVDAPVQLVTIGRAFHWMNRVQTVTDLDPLIDAGGAIALINDAAADVPMNGWWRAANDVARSFAVLDAYNQHRKSEAWVPHIQLLQGTTFSKLQRISVFAEHIWDFDTLIRHTLSRSATTEALIGEKRQALEAQTREALAPFGPGPWTSLNEHTALIARRA